MPESVRNVMEKQEGHVIDNGSYVRIEPDEMTAWLYLNPPNHGGKFTKQNVLDFLQKNGVTRGYHVSNISAMVKKEVYEREIKVAVGKTAVEGKDGYYEYKFAPVFRKVPEVREDGSVDYASMNELQNIRKGEVVAIYHVDHPDVYVAQQEGKIELRDNKIDIKSVHEIMGDVDLIIGRIEFFGDVVINGNVSAGVVIRAGRNIVIKGTVEAVNMYAGGDIVLERGIQGAKKAKLTAKGSVFADFIEHTEVTAKGSVSANSILNSKVYAEEKVIASGKKGIILGGHVQGLQGIEARILGNIVETKTTVHAGYDKETYAQYIGIAAREEEAQEELSKTVDSMADILRRKRLAAVTMDEAEENKLDELNKRKEECFQKLDNIRQEKEVLAATIEKGKGAKVITEGEVFRGVTVGVEDGQLFVEENTSFMQYEYLNGMVEGSVRVL